MPITIPSSDPAMPPIELTPNDQVVKGFRLRLPNVGTNDIVHTLTGRTPTIIERVATPLVRVRTTREKVDEILRLVPGASVAEEEST